MAINVAINGFGRIGRCTLRAIYELGLQNEFNLVAINASGDLKTNAHLLKYDTTHGRFRTSVETEGENCIIIDGKKIAFYSTKDPKGVNWASHGVDVLLECTGAYTTKAKAQALLEQGAQRVLISAPGGDDVDTTIVMGVNHEKYDASKHHVISNASCTTNCLAPVVHVLLKEGFGVAEGLMTTIHSYTATQKTVDGPSAKDWKGGRSAAINIIPSSTGAGPTSSHTSTPSFSSASSMRLKVEKPWSRSSKSGRLRTMASLMNEGLSGEVARRSKRGRRGTAVPL